MKSGVGRSNLEIERVIKYSDNEHSKNNFIGVYWSNRNNKFVDFHKLMARKKKPDTRF